MTAGNDTLPWKQVGQRENKQMLQKRTYLIIDSCCSLPLFPPLPLGLTPSSLKLFRGCSKKTLNVNLRRIKRVANLQNSLRLSKPQRFLRKKLKEKQRVERKLSFSAAAGAASTLPGGPGSRKQQLHQPKKKNTKPVLGQRQLNSSNTNSAAPTPAIIDLCSSEEDTM